MKSPLKDPNRFVCAPALKEILPPDSSIKSFMFFSGHLEFPLLEAGYDVTLLTNKAVIFEFWQTVVRDTMRLVSYVEGLHSKMHPQLIFHHQTYWPSYRDPFERSSIFFLLNRYSHSGTISHGEFSMDNLNAFAIETLKNFSYHRDKVKLKFYEADQVEEGFKYSTSNDILLLPIGNYSPNLLGSDIINGYESYGLHHRYVKEDLEEGGHKFVLCYKKNVALLSLYADYNIVLINKFGMPTIHFDLAEDMIIHNLPSNE